jgi:hypothetical protein
MDDRGRGLLRHLYELQLEFFDHEGEEIAALRRVNEALHRSHEIIGRMLKVAGELMGLP